MKVEFFILVIRAEDDATVLEIGPFKDETERDLVRLVPVPGLYTHCVERWTSLDGTVEEL